MRRAQLQVWRHARVAEMNRIHRLDLGHVVLPESHPRHGEGTCPILSFAIESEDGIVVVDTGPRSGHPIIDEMYAPAVVSIIDALHASSLDERDVTAVVNTHLHFDHCGQNHLLGHAPVWVTAAEVEAASVEFYTVPEWAEISENRLRLSDDGEEVAPDIRLLHTPGHTPGHQSITVQTDHGLEIIVGQTCFSCAEYASGRPAPTDMHDVDWTSPGLESLTRLRRLGAVRAHFSHDRDTFEASP